MTRTLSFFSSWMAEVLRQPALMLSLVLGPFLVLLAFGEGAKLGIPAPRTVLVSPPAQEQRIQPVPDELKQQLQVVGETANEEEAREMLVDGEADLVAVLPPDPLQAVEQGEHANVRILTNEIDPVRKSYARTYLNEQVASINQQTLQKAIGDAQTELAGAEQSITRARDQVAILRDTGRSTSNRSAASRELGELLGPVSRAAAQAGLVTAGAAFVIPDLPQSSADDEATRAANRLGQNVERINARAASGDGLTLSTDELTQIDQDLATIEAAVQKARSIPPEVLSAPFRLEVENVAPFVPTYIGFYAPAVLALLLQHLAVTLAALSMSRVRLIGLMEMLRAAPVRPVEALTGNYLSYGLLCAVTGAALVAALVYGLDVPVFGQWSHLVGTLGLLVLASLGLGFVCALLSTSEQQAAQIAMLILIASVFFSGFIVPLDTIVWPARAISFGLPATYAIRTLQDVMLRGVLRTPIDMVVLGAGALVFFLLAARLLRREYQPR